MSDITTNGTTSLVLTSKHPLFTMRGYRTVRSRYARLTPVRRRFAFERYLHEKFLAWTSEELLEKLGPQCFWRIGFVLNADGSEPENHKVRVDFPNRNAALMFKLRL